MWPDCKNKTFEDHLAFQLWLVGVCSSSSSSDGLDLCCCLSFCRPLCLGWSNSVTSQHNLIPSRLAELRTATPIGQCQAGELVPAVIVLQCGRVSTLSLDSCFPVWFAVVLILIERLLVLCVRDWSFFPPMCQWSIQRMHLLLISLIWIQAGI